LVDEAVGEWLTKPKAEADGGNAFPRRGAETVAVREPSDVVGGLARSYLFEDLTTEELEPLASIVTTRRLVRGEALCRVGDVADEIYVVLSGEVKDSVVDAAGAEVVHFLHGPGMTVGEPAFFAVDRHRVVELIAVAPSVVIRLGRRELEPFMARHPSVKDRVLEKLASNTRWQTTMISSLMSRSLTDRLVLRLLELVDSSSARGAGLSRTPKISHATLAAMVGVSRENVNRALSALAAEGSIRQENGRYVLVDEQRLRRELARDWPLAWRRDRRRIPPPTQGGVS
jgi:CRP/FNR family transcriptional regulator, cyclic AMP receptor protein